MQNQEIFRYVAILRCRTWHTWPSQTHIVARAITIPFAGDKAKLVTCTINLVSYSPRPNAKVYPTRPSRSEEGLKIWRGIPKPGYMLGDAVMQATTDKTAYKLKFEPAYKGEIDIQLLFECISSLSPEEQQQISESGCLSALAIINLQLGDFLSVVAPIQLLQIVGGKLQPNSSFKIRAEERLSLDNVVLQNTMENYFLSFSSAIAENKKAKLRIALTLYATHFSERAASIRFLMLTMVLESLAAPQLRPKLVQDLIDGWMEQVAKTKESLLPSSEEFMSLESFERELLFRRDDSIGNQIRRLVREAVSDQDEVYGNKLVRRAMDVYRKRSTLIHEGSLPFSELNAAEKEAREIVEIVLRAQCHIKPKRPMSAS